MQKEDLGLSVSLNAQRDVKTHYVAEMMGSVLKAVKTDIPCLTEYVRIVQITVIPVYHLIYVILVNSVSGAQRASLIVKDAVPTAAKMK